MPLHEMNLITARIRPGEPELIPEAPVKSESGRPTDPEVA
jgi:hypothetical protein